MEQHTYAGKGQIITMDGGYIPDADLERRGLAEVEFEPRVWEFHAGSGGVVRQIVKVSADGEVEIVSDATDAELRGAIIGMGGSIAKGCPRQHAEGGTT